jgi:hypothetical protein
MSVPESQVEQLAPNGGTQSQRKPARKM